jgi:hypothetical protein
MAYASGVASSLDDFLAQLVTFAVTNAGFTNLGSVASSSGTGARTIQRIQKGSIVWNMTRSANNNELMAAMSYGAAAAGMALSSITSTVGSMGGAATQQYWTGMSTWAFTGPFVGHYFFTDGTCVYAVLEVAAGIYNHFSFGNMTKIGGWAGGEYLTGGWYQNTTTSGGNVIFRPWNDGFQRCPFPDISQTVSQNLGTYFRTADANAQADFAMCTAYGQAPFHGMFVGDGDQGSYAQSSFYGRLIRRTPNVSTQRTPLFPGIMRRYVAASSLYQIGATFPNVAFCKFAPNINPKDIINTDWQIFPITQRTGGNGVLAALSGEFAIAYRRV